MLRISLYIKIPSLKGLLIEKIEIIGFRITFIYLVINLY